MSVADALLGLLKVHPGHGYDLKMRYDALLDPSRSLQQAQVYATLARLERDSLVTVSGVDQGAGPPRRTFALTSLGRKELDRWLATPVVPAVQLHADLYSKVVLTAMTGGSVSDLLHRQRQTHMVRMREMTGLRQSSDLATSSLAEYALFHLEADLRWLELAADRADEVVRAAQATETDGR